MELKIIFFFLYHDIHLLETVLKWEKYVGWCMILSLWKPIGLLEDASKMKEDWQIDEERKEMTHALIAPPERHFMWPDVKKSNFDRKRNLWHLIKDYEGKSFLQDKEVQRLFINKRYYIHISVHFDFISTLRLWFENEYTPMNIWNTIFKSRRPS